MRKCTPGLALAATPTSRGVAAAWSKPGSAKPLCVATTGGISGNMSETFLTCCRKPMPTSLSSHQPLAYGMSPHAQ